MLTKMEVLTQIYSGLFKSELRALFYCYNKNSVNKDLLIAVIVDF